MRLAFLEAKMTILATALVNSKSPLNEKLYPTFLSKVSESICFDIISMADVIECRSHFTIDVRDLHERIGQEWFARQQVTHTNRKWDEARELEQI